MSQSDDTNVSRHDELETLLVDTVGLSSDDVLQRWRKTEFINLWSHSLLTQNEFDRDSSSRSPVDSLLLDDGVDDANYHLSRKVLAANRFAGKARLRRKWFIRDDEFMTQAMKRIQAAAPLMPLAAYADEQYRFPRQFSSNAEAYSALQAAARHEIYVRAMAKETTPEMVKLDVEAAIDIIRRIGIALTRDSSQRSPVLYAYDYDRQLYTTQVDILKTWLSAILGVVSPSTFQTFHQTLEAQPNMFAFFCRPPKWFVPVGNGMYDMLSNRLLPNSPVWTVTRRVSTRYNPNAQEPALDSGMTFRQLVSDLANYNERRERLIMQMCKMIVTGHSPKPACFIMVGRGGDGKSLFMKLMSRVVGSLNTGHMGIKDLGKDDVLHANADASLVIGFDNDSRATINETSTFKSFVTNEPFAVSRKYLSSVSIVFNGALVQLCNAMPRIFETGASMRRRIVVISAENSHYEASDEISSLESEINDESWHEYILKALLDEEECPFYSDFDDVDCDIMNSTLDSDDMIGQFITALIEHGVMSDDVEQVPVSLMYALYCDWMDIANPNNVKMGSRVFTIQFKQRLELHGFTEQFDKPVRLKTALNAKGSIIEDMMSSLRGETVDACINQNSTTRVLVRSGADRSETLNLSSRRNSELCSAEEYFGARHEFTRLIENNPMLVEDIVLEMLQLYEYDELDPHDELPEELQACGGSVEEREQLSRQSQVAHKPVHSDANKRNVSTATADGVKQQTAKVQALLNETLTLLQAIHDSDGEITIAQASSVDRISAEALKLSAMESRKSRNDSILSSYTTQLVDEPNIVARLSMCKSILEGYVSDHGAS